MSMRTCDSVCQAGPAGEWENRRAGKRAQDPGRGMREAGGLCWYSRDL